MKKKEEKNTFIFGIFDSTIFYFTSNAIKMNIYILYAYMSNEFRNCRNYLAGEHAPIHTIDSTMSSTYVTKKKKIT